MIVALRQPTITTIGEQTMILRGINFGKVLGASGVQGFFGEGYWFHHVPFFGPNFKESTFVAKTTTLEPRHGNMPLNSAYRPKEWLPKCIVVNRKHDVALNAVGLSGPGAEPLFETERWQPITRPFMFSFMSVASTARARMDELRQYVTILKWYKRRLRAPIALQINFTCPNTEHHANDLVGESEESFGIASVLDTPLLGKYNTNLPPEAGVKISQHPHCDALCMTNTIKWDEIGDSDRLRLFGTVISPLAEMGGGGISGRYLFSRLITWLKEAKKAGLKKPVNAGGGILSVKDALLAIETCPPNSSVFLGSVAFLHPRRVRPIITTLNQRR